MISKNRGTHHVHDGDAVDDSSSLWLKHFPPRCNNHCIFECYVNPLYPQHQNPLALPAVYHTGLYFKSTLPSRLDRRSFLIDSATKGESITIPCSPKAQLHKNHHVETGRAGGMRSCKGP